MRKYLISFAQVINFCKISSSRGGLTSTPLAWNGHGKSPLEKWGACHHQTPLSWHYPLWTSLFLISKIITWCPSQKCLHKPLGGASQKCFQPGPVLVKAGPVACVLRYMVSRKIGNALSYGAKGGPFAIAAA